MTKKGFCTAMCREAYLSDRRHGLIYGSYKLNGKFVDNKTFHAALRTCRYCGAPLKKAVARRGKSRFGR